MAVELSENFEPLPVALDVLDFAHARRAVYESQRQNTKKGAGAICSSPLLPPRRGPARAHSAKAEEGGSVELHRSRL